ncbi:hypothetical protein J2T14_005038 [Paenibacillus harenae]|nr:hypothetical protein [Paenibacillus harenae]
MWKCTKLFLFILVLVKRRRETLGQTLGIVEEIGASKTIVMLEETLIVHEHRFTANEGFFIDGPGPYSDQAAAP